ncbi:uncharacterized protein LOC128226049 [Mya arenaria]|uniref:uncharacterized protein LOC128226049 n=1 Tax=Mya arenaria TaxID=6604 RepID=UPI0022E8BC51|nr:uncharacterized protein LOC128226049 [Mya arenaria]
MDVVTAALTLREHLVSLQASDNNIAAMDCHLSELGGACLRAEMQVNQYRQLHLLLRLCVCEGVHTMFTTYSTRKWAQVQSTAKSQLEADDSELMTSPVTSSPAGGSTRPDKAAAVWASMDSTMYRTE